jgi:hypothetical protein
MAEEIMQRDDAFSAAIERLESLKQMAEATR